MYCGAARDRGATGSNATAGIREADVGHVEPPARHVLSNHASQVLATARFEGRFSIFRHPILSEQVSRHSTARWLNNRDTPRQNRLAHQNRAPAPGSPPPDVGTSRRPAAGGGDNRARDTEHSPGSALVRAPDHEDRQQKDHGAGLHHGSPYVSAPGCPDATALSQLGLLGTRSLSDSANGVPERRASLPATVLPNHFPSPTTFTGTHVGPERRRVDGEPEARGPGGADDACEEAGRGQGGASAELGAPGLGNGFLRGGGTGEGQRGGSESGRRRNCSRIGVIPLGTRCPGRWSTFPNARRCSAIAIFWRWRWPGSRGRSRQMPCLVGGDPPAVAGTVVDKEGSNPPVCGSPGRPTNAPSGRRSPSPRPRAAPPWPPPATDPPRSMPRPRRSARCWKTPPVRCSPRAS